ncbi:hypothetical protein JI742_07575 [Piscinibacter sp. Jin2]|uniref:Hsp70 family protein n=1 Tax=Aquariibacter lacus TaxID=2801332 RepID=A0A9X1BQI7_9BURK|nr:hypothetical protein [Piscinibacter lacus]
MRGNRLKRAPKSAQRAPARPYHRPNFYFLRDKPVRQPVVPTEPALTFDVHDNVCLGWKPDELGSSDPLQRDEVLGARLEPPGATAGPARELVMGLDFGTSSTKVVIADRTMNAAYAVPFMDSVGVASYLLPSALLETAEGVYALAGSGKRLADLKLAMLSALSDERACARGCAFLALTIRQARAWLYESKGDQYLRADILWTLAIGQPADQAASEHHRRHFEQLAKVAWQLAGSQGSIGVETALNAWSLRAELNLDDELEVRPMAELSAQIHGFVSSSHFDARLPNIYLLVDVGAGTVDASLFHVRKDRGGTVSFDFFTHAVELLGAANLNRARLAWWLAQLRYVQGQLEPGSDQVAKRIGTTVAELESMKLPTEFRGRYPDSYRSYVKGVEVGFEGGAKNPDEDFYQRVRNQVAGKVLYGAWKQMLLTQEAVRGMPFFLCGGGGRHPFYAALKTRLQKTDGCTWLNAKPRELALPTNISAPGVAHGDYDRLSVAYGLSQLNPGTFERVVALKPRVFASEETDWNTVTVDKSVC